MLSDAGSIDFRSWEQCFWKLGAMLLEAGSNAFLLEAESNALRLSV
jgi:hypothetical protein